MRANPKVSVFVEPTDRIVNVIEERFDIAIRAQTEIEDVAGLVAKTLGNSQRAMVVSPAFLARYGRPENASELPNYDTVASTDDIFDGGARWNLATGQRTMRIELKPRLVTSDLRVRLQAAVHGIGIALLPEQVISRPLKERLVERVLPEWSGANNILHLVYPTPRGMLPSVRSLIDYLLIASSAESVGDGERQ
jgi:DNA-binding transcriptional LysR family regulator